MDLKTGTVFDTAYETGCVVVVSPEDYTTPPGRSGVGYTAFLAKAPDGVECEYITAMVKGHPDYDPR